MSASDDFRALHGGSSPLIVANCWDVGSARLFESIGFLALATTSSGFAATLGRLDGGASADEVFDHGAALVAGTDLPITADLENGFAHEPTDVARTVARARSIGLAGCSIEDYTGSKDDPLYSLELAVERIEAAVDAAAGEIVLTARAEGHIRGHPVLADTIERLQRFGAAGADVLFAPGLVDLADIATLVAEVDRPVNVLARPGGPTVAELASVGVKRVSVGGSLAWVGVAAVDRAARELFEHGTLEFLDDVAAGVAAGRAAFG